MKSLIFLPLAYLADVQGFLLFAPYIAVFLSLALVLRLARRPVPVVVRA